MRNLGDTFISWLDSAALVWLNGRTDRYARQHANDDGWNFNKLDVDTQRADLELFNDNLNVFLLAEQCARLLEGKGADNYLQFDMLPKLTRQIRPVRLTVQWAHGESPAEQNSRLRKEAEALRGELRRLVARWRNEPDDFGQSAEASVARARALRDCAGELRAILPPGAIPD